MKFFLAFIFIFSSVACAMEIEGKYEIIGWDPYYKEDYTGIAMISKGENNIYTIEWHFSNGEKYKGTGLLYGDVLSFCFLNQTVPKTREITGLEVFVIKETGLYGSWLLWDQALIGTEKLIKR
jgi:hypothetical protein